jgi:iron complex transport system substrate-binding protein
MPRRAAAASLAAVIIGALLFGAPPAAAGPVEDEIGRLIHVPDDPQRIVALTPSLVEIVFALGLGGRVVGVTTWADHPPGASDRPKVGDYVSPNLEKIIALAPDLVLANREGNPPWVVEKLERAGVPVYVHWPRDPRSLPRSFVNIGRICGAPGRGRELAADLQAVVDDLDRRLKDVEPVSTLLVIGANPLVSVNRRTFHGRLLELVRADNVASDAPGNWPRLSLEFVISSQPSVIVVSSMERGGDLQAEIDYWRTLPGLGGAGGPRVVGISSDLIDRPGPRLGEGLRALARAVHPGLFRSEDGAK